MRRATLVAFGVLSFGDWTSAQKKAESVCQILGHLEDFSGQIVSVRTELSSGPRLVTENCAVKILVGPFEFRNWIAVEWPDGLLVKYEHLEVPFSTDESSRDLLFSALRVRQGLNPKLYATVEGLVVTRRPPMALVLKNNPQVRIGFGPSNSAPAAIIIKRVSEIDLAREREDGTREKVPIP